MHCRAITQPESHAEEACRCHTLMHTACWDTSLTSDERRMTAAAVSSAFSSTWLTLQASCSSFSDTACTDSVEAECPESAISEAPSFPSRNSTCERSAFASTLSVSNQTAFWSSSRPGSCDEPVRSSSTVPTRFFRSKISLAIPRLASIQVRTSSEATPVAASTATIRDSSSSALLKRPASCSPLSAVESSSLWSSILSICTGVKPLPHVWEITISHKQGHETECKH